jgi:hypothetical protein
MTVTENCAVNPGALYSSQATSWRIQPYTNFPGDEPARFIAPFAADDKNINHWIAGGQHVWFNSKGFAIRNGKEWTNAFDLGAGHTATAVAISGDVAYVGWCGPCNNAGFARGIAVGKYNDPASWHQLNLPIDGTIPNRFITGFAVDPANPSHAFVAINGFSRRFTEGPGAGFGHIFETTDMGNTWADVSANLPDVPANSVKMLSSGALVLGTDLATFYRPAGTAQWKVLGANLPTTVVMDVEYSSHDDALYVATHGRGIWRFGLEQL